MDDIVHYNEDDIHSVKDVYQYEHVSVSIKLFGYIYQRQQGQCYKSLKMTSSCISILLSNKL